MPSKLRSLLLPSLLLGACAHMDPYVWVDAYGAQPASENSAYVIGPGDLVDIRVWNQDKMSAKVRVRTDGRVSVPFLNDFAIAGLTPTAAARSLEAKLKDYIVNAMVYVSIEESRPMTVAVMGEVTHPGSYPLEAGAGVTHALASAGGFTEFADRKRIFVLRQGKQELKRIRFAYDDLVRARGLAASFRLQNTDVVVVE
jgi:polysaccharide export outer membrane protein